MVLSNRRRGNGHTLVHRKFHLKTKKSVTVHVTKYWKRLPREDVDSSLLKIFKNYPDTVLCHVL